MKTATRVAKGLRCSALLLPVLGLSSITACASRPMLELSSSQRLTAEIRSILGTSRSSPEYHNLRLELQEMGPEVDVILVGLAGDTRAHPELRADALVLLADRRSPLALPTLEAALQSRDARLRAAAVLGLSRLASTSEEAMGLIRIATTDRSRTVRLNAMQSLDIRDVETIRRALERERDREVRLVGVQLIALAEARGAPLAVDSRGALRSVAGEWEPQIVFRPVAVDAAGRVASGDLRIEMPEGTDIPLAASAIVVASVVPAFFASDRSRVVVEADGEIRVVQLGTRAIRGVGPGIAPRPIPFTQDFVFVREQEQATATPGEILYGVYRASFIDGEPEFIDYLRARVDPAVHGGESPVRWMVVDEDEDGFILRGENMDVFPLPTSGWGASAASGGHPQISRAR